MAKEQSKPARDVRAGNWVAVKAKGSCASSPSPKSAVFNDRVKLSLLFQ
jgi:hypothetical protein